MLAQRDSFSLGGPGPSGTVIQTAARFNKAGNHGMVADDDDEMEEEPAPVVFEAPTGIVYSRKGKGKAAEIEPHVKNSPAVESDN